MLREALLGDSWWFGPVPHGLAAGSAGGANRGNSPGRFQNTPALIQIFQMGGKRILDVTDQRLIVIIMRRQFVVLTGRIRKVFGFAHQEGKPLRRFGTANVVAKPIAMASSF